MTIWIVSMEYAGISEAGGVKNVTCSLCEELSRSAHDVTLFLPAFGSNTYDGVSQILENCIAPVAIPVYGKQEIVTYSMGKITSCGATVVFVHHPVFEEKLAVYTYTDKEEAQNPIHKRGNGHEDTLLIDTIFQRAVAEFGIHLSKDVLPDIIHCQDAATAVLPAYIAQYADVYKITKCVVTIHNAGPAYHHEFQTASDAESYTGLPAAQIREAMNGKHVEPFLLAAPFAALTTVSKEYAEELTDSENLKDTDGLSKIFAERKIKITGITNGIDFERYNPEHPETSTLPFPYSPEHCDLNGKYKNRAFFLEHFAGRNEPELHAGSVRFLSELTRSGWLSDCTTNQIPVFFCYHGRIVSQKGITILEQSCEEIFGKYPFVRVIIIGQGEPALEKDIERMTLKYEGRLIYFKGYNRALARLATASSDFLVMPSNFEPCGLEDYIAQIFGTLPVAHATGGLKKIIEGKTGFLYEPNTSEALTAKIEPLIEKKEENPSAFNTMITYAASYVHNRYDWHSVVNNQYIPFFIKLISNT